MQYDLAIIGAGWAGFNAAKKAQASGLKVAVIEQDQVGGTCLNRGCIPTKALIQSSKVYSLIKKSRDFGIRVSGAELNFSEVQARKDNVVGQLCQGMSFLLKGIDFINAQAHFVSKNTLNVGGTELNAEYILIACGSKPLELKSLPFDGTKIISSDDILKLDKIPASLLIVGGGVIGCEFASLFNNFGSDVTLVEKLPQLLPGEDAEIARKLESIFKKRGIRVNTNADASVFDLAKYELVLVCVGRLPDTKALKFEEISGKLENGKIIVDEYLRTNIDNIYAAGDCAAKIMLAHYAAYQGAVAVFNIINKANVMRADNNNVPGCIFTDPEVAGVGTREALAKDLGIETSVHKFDFLGSGMARILDETEGFIKIISGKSSNKIIGASIIGPKATELVSVLGVAIQNGLTVSQLRDTIFAHPTLSESIHEALK